MNNQFLLPSGKVQALLPAGKVAFIEEVKTELVADQSTEKKKNKTIFISAYDLLINPVVKRVFLLDNLIPAANICLLSGPSEAGKSMLARQIATAIALGKTEVCSFNLNIKHNRAIVVSTEDNDSSWKDKIECYKIAEPDQPLLDNLSLVFDDAFSCHLLEERLKIFPTDFIVIDVFTDFFRGDLNNQIAVREFFKPYKALCRKYGCTIMFIHHLTKKGQQSSPSKLNVSGSDAIANNMRCVLELRSDPNDNMMRHLIMTKGNDFKPAVKETSTKLKLLESLEFEDTGEHAPINNLGSSKPVGTKPEVLDRIKILSETMSARGISQQLKEEGFFLGKSRISEIIKQLGKTEKE